MRRRRSKGEESKEPPVSAVPAGFSFGDKHVYRDGELRMVSFRGSDNSVHPNPPGPHQGSWGYRIAQMLFLAVMEHYFSWPFLMAVGLYLIYAYVSWWVAVVLLCVYLLSFFNKDELRGGREWNWIRNHRMWGYVQDYLGVEVVAEAELPVDDGQQYLFAVYPHGILIQSRCLQYGGVFDFLFPKLTYRTLAATPMFYAPGCRDICLYHGAIDARKSSAEFAIKQGHSVMVYPGGSKEIFTTDARSKDTVVLQRSGFLRLALKHQMPIVPCFVFGEKWVYNSLRLPPWIEKTFMAIFRLPLIVFWGRFFSLIPLQKPMSMVFGKPLEVPDVTNLSDEEFEEEVELMYGKYYGAIEDLYNQYRDIYGYDEDEKLVMRPASSKKNGEKKEKTKGL